MRWRNVVAPIWPCSWPASSDQLAVFVWDDTRDGDELTQTQDIFSAAAQFQAVGSSTSTARWYVLGAAEALRETGGALSDDERAWADGILGSSAA